MSVDGLYHSSRESIAWRKFAVAHLDMPPDPRWPLQGKFGQMGA